MAFCMLLYLCVCVCVCVCVRAREQGEDNDWCPLTVAQHTSKEISIF